MCCLLPSLLFVPPGPVVPHHKWCHWLGYQDGGFSHHIWDLLGHRLCHCKVGNRGRGNKCYRCLSHDQDFQVQETLPLWAGGVESWASPQREGQSCRLHYPRWRVPVAAGTTLLCTRCGACGLSWGCSARWDCRLSHHCWGSAIISTTSLVLCFQLLCVVQVTYL